MSDYPITAEIYPSATVNGQRVTVPPSTVTIRSDKHGMSLLRNAGAMMKIRHPDATEWGILTTDQTPA